MEMLNRVEFKFLVSVSQRAALFEAFGGRMRPDEHAGASGAYPVVSLYYDTPDRQCFWESWRGLPSRRKLRVRIYGTLDGAIAPASFVEVKHKIDGRGAKRRVQTSMENALALASGSGSAEGFSEPERRTLEEVRRLALEEGFQPACLIRYRRHAYSLDLGDASEGGGVRITFDDQLCARFHSLTPSPDDRGEGIPLLAEGFWVMELKAMGSVPYELSLQLARCGLHPRSFSKYATAVGLHKGPGAGGDREGRAL